MKNRKNQIFRRLRNRLILITVAVSTIVLVVAFSMIYFLAQDAGRRRPFPPDETPRISDPASDFVRAKIQSEREAAQKSLLVSLVIIGAGVEISVVFLSYILAEAAIRPVKNAYEAQKIFIANASHEMKTPIAAISANFEAADFPESQWTKNIAHEIQVLSHLNRDLLNLAQAEAGDDNSENSENPHSKNLEKVDLEKSVRKILELFAPQISARGLKIDFQAAKMPKIELVRADFEQIITILLDNAVKYAKTHVKIHVKPHHFSIENDGAKIPEQALPHLFERFYQADKNAPGAGLGLAIAKALADRQGWKISVAQTPLAELAQTPAEKTAKSEKSATSTSATSVLFRLDF